MLGQVKFSEAISSIWPRCRSSSRPISSAISGSTSASRAPRRSWSGRPADGERPSAPRCYSARGRSLAQDARLGAGEVEHGRRHAGQLAAVDLGRAAGADLRRDVVEAARVGPAVAVGARRRHRADRRDDARRRRPAAPARGRRSSRRRRARDSAAPGSGGRACTRPGSRSLDAAARLGDELEQRLDVRAEERDRRSRPAGPSARQSRAASSRERARGRRRCRSAGSPPRPARRAATASIGPRRRGRARPGPALTATSVVAELSRAGPRSPRRAASPTSSTSEPAGPEQRRGRRARPPPSAPRRRVASSRLPVAHLRLERRRSRAAETYGGFETTRS